MQGNEPGEIAASIRNHVYVTLQYITVAKYGCLAVGGFICLCTILYIIVKRRREKNRFVLCLLSL